MDYKQNAVEAAASKAAYAASGGAIFLGMTANEIAALGGLILAIIMAVINLFITWHFKSQHLKLARERAAGGDDGDA